MTLMPDTHNHPPPVSRRERWLHRIALLLMAIFTALGVYVLYYPSDALIAVFGTLAVVTIMTGVIAGILAVYSS